MTLPMTPSTPAWEQTAAAWMLTYLVHSSLLLSAAWMLSRLPFLQRARLQETLWKAALLGGVFTASLQALPGFQPLMGNLRLAWIDAPVFGAEESEIFTQRRRGAEEGEKQSGPRWHFLRRIPQPAPQKTKKEEMTLSVRFPSLPDGQGIEAHAEILRLPAVHGIAAHLQPPGQGGSLRWASVVLGLWAAGAVLLLLRLAILKFRLQRRLKGRREEPHSGMDALLDELRRRAGWARPVRLTFSDRISGPLVLGRKEICVPRRAASGLSCEEQQSLLAHELAHIVRRDCGWLAVSALLSSLFFFQPLNWLARRRLQEEAEYLCDDWAVEQTGTGVCLARCLAQVAGWMQSPPRTALAPGMAGRPSVFVSRVRRLCRDAKPPAQAHGWRRWAAALLLPVAVALLAPVISVASPALANWTAPEGKYLILRLKTSESSQAPEIAPKRKLYRL